VTLEEAMEHSRLEDNYDEMVIQGCLTAAHSLVEQWLNRKLVNTKMLAVQEDWQKKVKLPYAPIISVNSITALDLYEDSITLVAGTDYRVDLVRNLVILDLSTTQGYTEFNINYNCGYQTLDCVPPAILHAIKMTFANLYENREDSVVGVPIYKVPLTAQRIVESFKAPNFV